MDRVHVVDESLHRLVYTADRPVDGMLDETGITRQPLQGAVEIVLNGSLIEMFQILSAQLFQGLDLFDVAFPDERSQIEVESRNGLSAMHFILGCFQ